MKNFFRCLLGLPAITPLKQPISRPMPTRRGAEMDEGDYHSGPHGYTPNTAYPETQYGSNFDEEAEWNEEH